MSQAFAAVVLFTLLPLFLALGTRGENVAIDWWWLLALMLLIRGLGLDMIGVARMGSAIRELQIARRELARLAVIEERERLARDLHDLLGHTLSVITLKSELAGCLVTEEPGRCIRELADIERVSRQMLREVRKTVAGYRQPTLANELDGARQLLEAARVACVVEQTIEDFPPALDATLAWTVREGVTNVIRHSRARQCFIRLASDGSTRERVCVEVLNDGVLPDNQRKGQYEGQGSGLSGLRECVAMFGGNMEAGFLTGSGKEQFRLWVALPVQMDGETVGVLAGMQENGG